MKTDTSVHSTTGSSDGGDEGDSRTNTSRRRLAPPRSPHTRSCPSVLINVEQNKPVNLLLILRYKVKSTKKCRLTDSDCKVR